MSNLYSSYRFDIREDTDDEYKEHLKEKLLHDIGYAYAKKHAKIKTVYLYVDKDQNIIQVNYRLNSAEINARNIIKIIGVELKAVLIHREDVENGRPPNC